MVHIALARWFCRQPRGPPWARTWTTRGSRGALPLRPTSPTCPMTWTRTKSRTCSSSVSSRWVSSWQEAQLTTFPLWFFFSTTNLHKTSWLIGTVPYLQCCGSEMIFFYPNPTFQIISDTDPDPVLVPAWIFYNNFIINFTFLSPLFILETTTRYVLLWTKFFLT